MLDNIGKRNFMSVSTLGYQLALFWASSVHSTLPQALNPFDTIVKPTSGQSTQNQGLYHPPLNPREARSAPQNYLSVKLKVPQTQTNNHTHSATGYRLQFLLPSACKLHSKASSHSVWEDEKNTASYIFILHQWSQYWRTASAIRMSFYCCQTTQETAVCM